MLSTLLGIELTTEQLHAIISGTKIKEITALVMLELFPKFGLPLRLEQ